MQDLNETMDGITIHLTPRQIIGIIALLIAFKLVVGIYSICALVMQTLAEKRQTVPTREERIKHFEHVQNDVWKKFHEYSALRDKMEMEEAAENEKVAAAPAAAKK